MREEREKEELEKQAQKEKEESKAKEENQIPEPEPSPESEEPLKPKKKKKRKKKKKKKKTKKKLEEDLFLEAPKEKSKTLIWKNNPNEDIYTYREDSPRYEDLLKADTRKLNYLKEMQRLFHGTDFSQGSSGGYEGWTKRQKNMHQHQMKRLRPKKKYYLVANEDVKIKLNDRLQLTEDRHEPGLALTFYKFEAAGKLKRLGELYSELKNTHDISTTFDFLNTNPYFPEALYDIGEYYRLKGNFKEANFMLEKLVFFYEDSFPYEFRLFESNASKMNMQPEGAEEIPELVRHQRRVVNYRSNSWSLMPFKAIFKFLAILTKKSCYRSALEFSKVLLRLDPLTDPMGALLMVDHVSIASGSYEFFQELALTYAHRYFHSFTSSILLYPSILFSFALSHFLNISELEKDKKSKSRYHFM